MQDAWIAIATLWAILLGALATTLLAGRDRDRRRRRQMERAPTRSIKDATVGSVIKIAGKAEAVDGLIEAPLSGRRAIAFVARAELLYTPKRGKRLQGAQFYRGEKRARDFLVRDETGVALVRVARAHVIAEPRDVFSGDGARKRWLRSRGGRTRFLWLIPRSFRFSETALAPGSDVVVLGQCVRRSGAGADGPYRDAAEPAITIEAARFGGLVLCWSSAPNSTSAAEPLFTP